MDTSWLPPELLKWADVPLIALCVLVSHVVRPWVSESDSGLLRGDRVLLLPLLVGLAIGVSIELSTPGFDVNMAIRRTLTTGCGAAVAFRAAKIFLPGLFAEKATAAAPPEKP